MNDAVVFRCIIAPLGSALKFDGSGNGARLTLEIPATETINALPILGMMQAVLEATFRVVDRPRD